MLKAFSLLPLPVKSNAIAFINYDIYIWRDLRWCFLISNFLNSTKQQGCWLCSGKFRSFNPRVRNLSKTLSFYFYRILNYFHDEIIIVFLFCNFFHFCAEVVRFDDRVAFGNGSGTFFLSSAYMFRT